MEAFCSALAGRVCRNSPLEFVRGTIQRPRKFRLWDGELQARRFLATCALSRNGRIQQFVILIAAEKSHTTSA